MGGPGVSAANMRLFEVLSEEHITNCELNGLGAAPKVTHWRGANPADFKFQLAVAPALRPWGGVMRRDHTPNDFLAPAGAAPARPFGLSTRRALGCGFHAARSPS